MANNLVMGMAYNYKPEQIDVFVKSLRQYYNDKILLVTHPLDQRMKDYCNDNDIITFEIDEQFNIRLLCFLRWYFYKHVIEDHFEDVDNIILCDTRDVVFQSNPFDHLIGKDVEWSIDPELVGNCLEHNGKWILDIYGQEEFDRAKDQYILCAGFVAGTRKGILEVVNAMVDEAIKLQQENKLTFADQGSLNVLYARGMFPNSIINDHFRTMHHSKTLKFDRKGYLINDENQRVAVVHCYDRLGHLNITFVKNALKLTGKEGLKKAAEHLLQNFYEWDLG